jgi:putative membrane protein
MHFIPTILTLLIAALHGYILYLEMFAWEKPRTRKAFQMEEGFATQTKAMAANQGLYNGFLAAGLLWGVIAGAQDFVVFFLLCVMVAGIYGSQTVFRKILFIQTIPAVITLVAVFVF